MLAALKPRLRKPAIVLGVGLLAVVVLSFYGLQALLANRDDGAAASGGSKVPLMCVACNAHEDRPVQNIHDLRCRQCGAKLGFAFHCNDCNKDFAFIPPEDVKTLGDFKGKPECTQCKSWNAVALKLGASTAAPPKAGKGATPKGGKGATPKAGKVAAPKAGSAPAKAALNPVRSAKPAPAPAAE